MPRFDLFLFYSCTYTYFTMGCYLPTLIPAFIDRKSYLLDTPYVSGNVQTLYMHCLIEVFSIIFYTYLHFVEEGRSSREI